MLIAKAVLDAFKDEASKCRCSRGCESLCRVCHLAWLKFVARFVCNRVAVLFGVYTSLYSLKAGHILCTCGVMVANLCMERAHLSD